MSSGKNRAKNAGRFTGNTSFTTSSGGPVRVPSAPTYQPGSGGRIPSQRVPETRAAGAAQQQWANTRPISSLGDPTVTDPSAADYLASALPGAVPTPPGGGGGGGRRGGGGGGGGGVSPKVRAAYQALWNSQLGKAADMNKGYDDYEARLGKVYDPTRFDPVYDRAQTGVTSASKAGQERLVPILQGLNDRAAQGRTAMNEAYSAGDDRLAALESEYAGRMGAATGGLNDVLSGFDVGGIAPTGADALTNLMANSRVANARMQTVADAGMADRPAVYEGLNADVSSGMARDEAGLMNQIAMNRLGTGVQSQSQLDAALAQAGLTRMQAEQQRQADQDRLRIELAQMGMVPPSTFTGSWS